MLHCKVHIRLCQTGCCMGSCHWYLLQLEGNVCFQGKNISKILSGPFILPVFTIPVSSTYCSCLIWFYIFSNLTPSLSRHRIKKRDTRALFFMKQSARREWLLPFRDDTCVLQFTQSPLFLMPPALYNIKFYPAIILSLVFTLWWRGIWGHVFIRNSTRSKRFSLSTGINYLYSTGADSDPQKIPSPYNLCPSSCIL